jgi:hypothetical protein
MGKQLPITKAAKTKRFLAALERTGSPGKAAMETLDIGSRGGKNLVASAAAAGTQLLNSIKPSLLEAYEKKGITPEKLADTNYELLHDEKSEVVQKALDTAIKVGVGGGYAAERTMNLNINANADELNKHRKLAEEYEQKLLSEISNA